MAKLFNYLTSYTSRIWLWPTYNSKHRPLLKKSWPSYLLDTVKGTTTQLPPNSKLRPLFWNHGQVIQLLDTVKGTPTQLAPNSKHWLLFWNHGQAIQLLDTVKGTATQLPPNSKHWQLFMKSWPSYSTTAWSELLLVTMLAEYTNYLQFKLLASFSNSYGLHVCLHVPCLGTLCSNY